ncbi:MAG TPA: lytic transglycosylase domain-containing protein [Solirubrobacteraceae bacterium]|nr:lytic transglycosylase domain-containing protein [Solirubrobacteraceae bacterium]
MSVITVTDRIDEIRALLGEPTMAAGTGAARAPVDATGFSAQLASATAATATTPGVPVSGGGFDDLISSAAQRNGVDPALLKALIRQESNFDPRAGSPAGAQGLTQLMPGTAASVGVTDPYDPAQSIEGGAKYLRRQLDAFGGDERLALAAYNAGPGAVRRYGDVPPYAETRAYVEHVLQSAAQYRAAGTGATASTTTTGAGALPYQTV